MDMNENEERFMLSERENAQPRAEKMIWQDRHEKLERQLVIEKRRADIAEIACKELRDRQRS